MTDQIVTLGNTLVVKGSSANALSVGVGGTTNPVLNVVTNVGSQVTGVQITGQTSGSGGLLAAIGSANESLLLQGVGTGIVQTTATTASATVGALKAINSNASAVGMAGMLSNLSANNTANAAELGFSMNNSTPAEKQFGAIRVTSSTVTAGAEGGTMILRTMQSGTMTTVVTLSSAGLTTLANGLTMTSGAITTSSTGVSAPGATPLILNAPTGQTVALQINNATVVSIASTGMTVNSITSSGAALNLNAPSGQAVNIQVNGATIMQGIAGFTIGSAAGGDKGSGTLNVSANIYLNNTAYTNPDFVFEHAFTGAIRRFKKRPGATDYAGLMSLPDVEAFTRKHWHLPLIPHDGEAAGIVERFDWLLANAEQDKLYLFDHEHRLAALEAQMTARRKMLEP